MRMSFWSLTLLALVPLAVLACSPRPAQPQAPPRAHLVGFLSNGVRQPWMGELEVGLRELGYMPAQNISIEYRFAEGNQELISRLADELVGMGADAIVTADTPATRAAKASTTTIPIVMVTSPDPVGEGLVESLRLPGGNVTGLTSRSTELAGKRLELLKEWLPDATTVAVLWNGANPALELQYLDTLEAAPKVGVQLRPLPVRTPDEIDPAVEAAAAAGAGALMGLGDPFTVRYRDQIIAAVERHRLPSVFSQAQFAEAGGLMAYGLDLREQYRRTAMYVDKVLRGARPADLPVEQHAKFELTLNLKGAEALGFPIPLSIRERADRVMP